MMKCFIRRTNTDVLLDDGGRLVRWFLPFYLSTSVLRDRAVIRGNATRFLTMTRAVGIGVFLAAVTIDGFVAIGQESRGQKANESSVGAGSRYALLVGVHSYDKASGLRPLTYTHNDVTALAILLQQTGYREENIVLMTDSQDNPKLLPERSKITEQLSILLRDRTKDDSVLLAFAGHGVQFGKGGESYFCPLDASIDNKESLVSIDQIYTELTRCSAGFKFVIYDACRNDPYASASRGLTFLDEDERTLDQDPPGGIATFYSCSGGESAYEDSDIRHGVFFYFVLRGLSGEADFDSDHQITVPELELFTKRQVLDYVRSGFNGARQMPALRGETSGLATLTVVPEDGTLIGTVGLASNELVKDQGEVTAPRFGFYPLEVEESVAEYLTVPDGSVWIAAVYPSGAADRAGLRPGDVVQSIDGRPIRDLDSLNEVLQSVYKNARLGSKHIVSTLRNGKSIEFQVALQFYPAKFDSGSYWIAHDPADIRRLLTKQVGIVQTAQLAGNILLAQGNTGVNVWSITEDKCKLVPLPVRNVRVASLCDGGKLALLGDKDGRLSLWSLSEGKIVREIGPDKNSRLADIAVSQDGGYATEISTKGVVRRWRLEDGKKINEIDVKKLATKAGRFVWSPDDVASDYLFAMSANGRYAFLNIVGEGMVVDFVDESITPFLKREADDGSFSAFCVSPDEGKIAVGLSDGQVQVFDWKTGEYLHAWKGHEKQVDGVTFYGDTIVASASSDERRIRVWSLSDNGEVWQFNLQDRVGGGLFYGPSCLGATSPGQGLWAGGVKMHEFAIPQHVLEKAIPK